MRGDQLLYNVTQYTRSKDLLYNVTQVARNYSTNKEQGAKNYFISAHTSITKCSEIKHCDHWPTWTILNNDQ